METKGFLLVDDEVQVLKYFSKVYRDHFPVYSAASAEEAIELLDAHHGEIAVVIADQCMPGSSGVELLKTVRKRYPEIERILTTAYSELDILVEAINAGAVHSFVSKPWMMNEFDETLLKALEHHRGRVQRNQLLEQKIDELKLKILEDRAYDVGLISAKMGHYVHNALCPLTFLIDQLIEKGEGRTSYPLDYLQSVRAHIYEIARTLKDLEQVSVPPAPTEYALLDLEVQFDEALAATEVIRNRKNLRIEKMVQGTLPPIRGASSQIEKLFRFMIAEEIVSLPSDSLVRARFSPHEADGEILGVNIEFEDFAPISPRICPENLLHPFNLRGSNPREFGIFLVSCYFIVRHHGGSLNAKVKEDQGLCFSFLLPRDPVEAGLDGAFPFMPQSLSEEDGR
jgi:FixJ family two-component response regulator